MADWDKAKAAAMKILGPKAKVPDVPATILKAHDGWDKANDAFKDSRDGCEAKLLDIENAASGMQNAIKQFIAQVEKSTFGLDAKSKDDAKKVAQAQKILTGELNGALKEATDNMKMLDELDKHLIQLGNYKGPPKTM